MDSAFYLVIPDICRRAGLLGQRYRTADGRYILDNKDLSRVRFTTDEYVSGLSGIEKISLEEAQRLIAGGGHSMEAPEAVQTVAEEAPETEETSEESETATEEDNNESTNEKEE